LTDRRIRRKRLVERGGKGSPKRKRGIRQRHLIFQQNTLGEVMEEEWGGNVNREKKTVYEGGGVTSPFIQSCKVRA